MTPRARFLSLARSLFLQKSDPSCDSASLPTLMASLLSPSCVQGLHKRELLQEVLPVIGENLRFQRLFTEYQDQLEQLRNK